MKRKKCIISWCHNLATTNGKGGYRKFCSSHHKQGYKLSDLTKNNWAQKHKPYYDKCISTIKNDIPISERGYDYYPFGIMKIGDSIETNRCLCPHIIKKYEVKFNIRLLRRKIDDNSWRIWRIS